MPRTNYEVQKLLDLNHRFTGCTLSAYWIMKLERYNPSALLRPFIKSFIIIESQAQGMLNRVLPDTSIVMAFRCSGKVNYIEQDIKSNVPTSVLSGLRKMARTMDYAKQTTTLLVIFKEGGASPFFREPLHEFFGISVALDNLVQRNTLDEIEERLAETTSNLQRIAVIERFLKARLNEHDPDRLIQQAIHTIQATRGTIRINDLLADVPVSRDPFEKRFRKITGTSPKQFASIVRLRGLIDSYSGKENLTEAAHAAGYFDQAHFIKDFSAFTGQTPGEFFKSANYW